MRAARLPAAPLLLQLLLLLFCAKHLQAAPKWTDFKHPPKAAAGSAGWASSDRKHLWKQFKLEHGKIYDAPEDSKRFAAFNSNLVAVIAHNQQPGVTFFRGINKYSDLTPDEFQAKLLMTPQLAANVARRTPQDAPPRNSAASRRLLQKNKNINSGTTATPTAFDWRSNGMVPPLRDQLGCGSCWAYASLAALEVHARIAGIADGSVDLSEQEMVDCAHQRYGYWSFGCDGGYIEDPFKYAYRAYSTPESSYPYTAITGNCVTPASPPSGSVKVSSDPGYSRVAASASEIMKAVSASGPLAVYWFASPEFFDYAGGIFPAAPCENITYINHAMAIVGYHAPLGPSHPDSYWIVRNSWGDTWGEAGYVRVEMTDDSKGPCLMYGGAIMPTKPVILSTATSNPRKKSG